MYGQPPGQTDVPQLQIISSAIVKLLGNAVCFDLSPLQLKSLWVKHIGQLVAVVHRVASFCHKVLAESLICWRCNIHTVQGKVVALFQRNVHACTQHRLQNRPHAANGSIPACIISQARLQSAL